MISRKNTSICIIFEGEGTSMDADAFPRNISASVTVPQIDWEGLVVEIHYSHAMLPRSELGNIETYQYQC